jgi:hypothetical protein
LITLYNEFDDKLDYVTKVILQEARLEKRLTNQLLVTMLSGYSKNPINLLINAPSGEGKNYVINKVISLFPKGDVLPLAGMTEKALFHRPGTLVIKDEITGEYESIETQLTDIQEQIREKKHEECSYSRKADDKSKRQDVRDAFQILEEKKKELLNDSKKLIDLSNKIIIFLDTPPERLLAGLLPLLSHDQYEVEYEFVDTNNGIKTRSNILRGWPVVIIAQALDYSKSPRFPEYARRFITTNPTMTQEKYNEAVDLILDKASVPDLIYQSEVISDYEKDEAREIIKGLKEQIQSICNDLEPGRNNIIIPFIELIRELIPKEKASDMTRANRLATYLRFLPLIHFDKRPRIETGREGDALSKEIIPIATFEDLQNTNDLMKYSDGVRPHILEWYYDVFLKAYEDKNDIPDSKVKKNRKGEEEETITEERVAVTSKDLIEKHKEQHNEILGNTKLLKDYLYPLLNYGYIDKISSVIDGRAKIYYPIITNRKYVNLFPNDLGNNLPQQKERIVVNSTNFISKEYIISKIRHDLRYYSSHGFFTTIKNHLDEAITIEELVEQYFGNTNDYFTIEKQSSNNSDSDKITTDSTTTTTENNEVKSLDQIGTNGSEEDQSKSLFNNPLISEEDLKDPSGYQYDPNIINNIDRTLNSDYWYCKNNGCKTKGDKWDLMKHSCKYKKSTTTTTTNKEGLN